MKVNPQQGWTSLWRHFFDRERTVAELTDSMIQWQERWKWDFVKINPPACYHALDWGAGYEFFPDPFREPVLRKPVIQNLEDLRRIASPASTPVLAEQLEVIRNLRNHFGPGLPMVHTVFSPIEIAHRMMTGRPMFLEFLRSAPRELHELLQRIADVFKAFCVDCLAAGADGIFFATKWASHKHMSWLEYEDFGKRYEMQILDALVSKQAWLILHVCGENTYLEKMLNYPVHVFSYDFLADGALDPGIVAKETGKWVLGGIDAERLEDDRQAVIAKAASFSQIERWMAGPSCVVPPRTSVSAIESLKLALVRSN